MLYISIDCGIKSLAISIIKFNNININEINLLYANVYKLTEKNINLMTIKDMLVITIELKKKLNELNDIINNINKENEQKIILIEYQMNANNKSNYICAQIIYHFTDNTNIIKIVNPSLKNTYNFTNELSYSNIITKYRTNYTANKNHTKNNFLYWIQTNMKHDLIKHINRKNYDDIADSFMMCVAYHNSQQSQSTSSKDSQL